MTSVYLEGALDGFILTHVQGLDELLDLILAAPILSLPPGQLLPLLCEVGVLVQRLLVHMAARHKSCQQCKVIALKTGACWLHKPCFNYQQRLVNKQNP